MTGTPGDDRLMGTAGQDVICGKGGDDYLHGAGDDDVLLGGRGNDALEGNRGSDVLDGGTGRDRLSASNGHDRIAGGDGDDLVLAGRGVDRITTGARDDDIFGGGGADVIDGGTGFNLCKRDLDDAVARCAYDDEPPAVAAGTASPAIVDVTQSDAEVTLRVRVVDDTGVRSVHLVSHEAWFPNGSAALESGSDRDGWWAVTLRIPRHLRPGTYTPDAVVFDRADRQVREPAQATVTVLDDDPDERPPEVIAVEKPAPGEVVDVSDPDYRGVPVQVRILDDISGVDSVFMTAHYRRPDGSWMHVSQSPGLRLVSGNVHDGIWRAPLLLDESHRNGTWSLSFWVQDRASAESYAAAHYAGPAYQSSSATLPIPGGGGDFMLVGGVAPD